MEDLTIVKDPGAEKTDGKEIRKAESKIVREHHPPMDMNLKQVGKIVEDRDHVVLQSMQVAESGT